MKHEKLSARQKLVGVVLLVGGIMAASASPLYSASAGAVAGLLIAGATLVIEILKHGNRTSELAGPQRAPQQVLVGSDHAPPRLANEIVTAMSTDVPISSRRAARGSRWNLDSSPDQIMDRDGGVSMSIYKNPEFRPIERDREDLRNYFRSTVEVGASCDVVREEEVAERVAAQLFTALNRPVLHLDGAGFVVTIWLPGCQPKRFARGTVRPRPSDRPSWERWAPTDDELGSRSSDPVTGSD